MNPKNIIVRMPNWLGDLVMATPVLADIRQHWPDAEITAMCQSNMASILKHDPHIDALFSYNKPSGWIRYGQVHTIIDEIRRGEYDLGIMLTNSISSAWWFWRGAVKWRIGYATQLRSWLLSQAVPWPAQKEQQHQVITYKMLLEPLGIPLSTTPPQLYLTDEERTQAHELLQSAGINAGESLILGINPGAAYGHAKCWIPERFVALTQAMLNNPRITVVYFGDSSGAPLVDKICAQLPAERVLNLAGKTSLRELMALISCCSLILTNDSGPMHVAAALRIPLVALFGSTSDTCTGPYLSGTVIHKHVACSPCYKRVCPIDFRCMKTIAVAEVQRELQKLIDAFPDQGFGN
jgi:heptosyltransferase-2